MSMKIGPNNSVNIQTNHSSEEAKIPQLKVSFEGYAKFASPTHWLDQERVDIPREITPRGRALTKQVHAIVKHIPTPFLQGKRS